MARRTSAEKQADFRLELGREFPYNDRPPKDWAEAAALGILADLCDRGGIKHALEDVECSDDEDESIRNEIVMSLAMIIRRAVPTTAPQEKP